jgi:transcriptional regulator with XRE-family HTH domain
MTDKALKQIGSKLQAARKLKGITQQEIANRVGISRTYYSQIENGDRDPSATIITNIAKALGVSIADILK